MVSKSRILRPHAVRGTNAAVVLQLLRRYNSLSRADLARHSSLSEGTVSRITSELIDRKLVREDGAENSTGGRPATRLRLDQHHLSLGVDVQRWEIRFSVSSLDGKVVESGGARTSADPYQTLDLVVEWYRKYARAHGASRFHGVGVSVRGLVNSKTGAVELGAVANWVRIPVRDYLQTALHVPVFVDNNVRLAAIAEYHSGSLVEIQSSHCLLFVVVDEGIGIGIVLDGKLYYGPSDAAGEFGQMIIADRPDPEHHDGPGCLEQLASNTALCDRYSALSGGSTPASRDVRARVRKICQRAMEGEAAAIQALDETCRYLGVGIANVVWGLNADAVVIHSAINQAWPLVGATIRSQFPQDPQILNFRQLLLRPSSLGDEAAMVGAAGLPFDGLFTHGELQAKD